MKFVYVLTSTEKDLYYEQCLMSAFSLRHFMPEAEIVVLTDNKTASTFTGKRAEIKKYVSDIVSVDFPETAGNVERSRVLKTTIPEHIKGDFLFIDCDTIICESLSDIEKLDYPVAAVLDGHVPLEEHKHKDYFLKREKKMHYTGTKNQGFHINSGVILYRDGEKSCDFFKKWHELWEYSFRVKHDHHDQGAFNEAFYQCGFGDTQLPGEWNCQISQGGLAFLEHAKIIHYFSSEAAGKNYVAYYKLADKNIQQRVKENGSIPDDIQKMILNPKFQFTKVHLLNDKRIIPILQSPLIFTLAELKLHCPKLFNILEGSVGACRTFAKKLKGKNK